MKDLEAKMNDLKDLYRSQAQYEHNEAELSLTKLYAKETTGKISDVFNGLTGKYGIDDVELAINTIFKEVEEEERYATQLKETKLSQAVNSQLQSLIDKRDQQNREQLKLNELHKSISEPIKQRKRISLVRPLIENKMVSEVIRLSVEELRRKRNELKVDLDVLKSERDIHLSDLEIKRKAQINTWNGEYKAAHREYLKIIKQHKESRREFKDAKFEQYKEKKLSELNLKNGYELEFAKSEAKLILDKIAPTRESILQNAEDKATQAIAIAREKLEVCQQDRSKDTLMKNAEKAALIYRSKAQERVKKMRIKIATQAKQVLEDAERRAKNRVTSLNLVLEQEYQDKYAHIELTNTVQAQLDKQLGRLKEVFREKYKLINEDYTAAIKVYDDRLVMLENLITYITELSQAKLEAKLYQVMSSADQELYVTVCAEVKGALLSDDLVEAELIRDKHREYFSQYTTNGYKMVFILEQDL